MTGNTPVTQRECALLHNGVTDQLNLLKESMSEFHTTLNGLVLGQLDLRKDLVSQTKELTELTNLTKDNNGRLKLLEKWQQRVIGATVLLALVVSVAGGWIGLVR